MEIYSNIVKYGWGYEDYLKLQSCLVAEMTLKIESPISKFVAI